jgi:hypothetical protein
VGGAYVNRKVEDEDEGSAISDGSARGVADPGRTTGHDRHRIIQSRLALAAQGPPRAAAGSGGRVRRLPLRDLHHLEGAVGVGQAELRGDDVIAAAGAGDGGRDLEQLAVDRARDPARREVPVERDRGDDPDARRVGIRVVAVLDDVRLAALEQQAVGVGQFAVAARDLDAIGDACRGVSPVLLLTTIGDLPPRAASMPLALDPAPLV